MNIKDHFLNLQLTNDQQKAVGMIESFLESDSNIFILKGYAGTGKTTLLKGLASYLNKTDIPFQLMAPTGRAAKIINDKTAYETTTIHKGIYSFNDLYEIKTKDEEGNESFLYYYKIRSNNEAHRSVFIIDEASMVSNIHSEGEFFRFGSGFLLNDLVTYTGLDNPLSNAKIIFIGDPAQLPPIGMNFSPALDDQYLKETFNLDTISTELTQVVRQNSDNSILKAATRIRQCISSGYLNNFDLTPDKKNIFSPAFESFLETYKSFENSKIAIAYKNKTAQDINQLIRYDKFGQDLPVQSGDTIIVGANNYRLDILNGEFGIVSHAADQTISRTVVFKLKNKESASVSLTWRYIEIIFPDTDNNTKSVSGYILENYLYGDNHLTSIEQRALYIDFKNRHPELKPKTDSFKQAIRTDAYFNCIMMKYGYAVTCHKAQGGEWNQAFVFWDYGVNDGFNFYKSPHDLKGKKNVGFYRWAYTAITRAAKSLFVINAPFFNSFSKLNFIDPAVKQAFEVLTQQNLSPLEVTIDQEKLELLNKFNLSQSPVQLQHQFLKLSYLCDKKNISISSYNQKGYEIWYTFSRSNDSATIKFWVNKKNDFTDKNQIVPSGTNNPVLANDVTDAAKSINLVNICYQSTSDKHDKIVFDLNTEMDKPFLGILVENLSNMLGDLRISIDHVEHLEWRDRYTFVRDAEKSVIDFVYDSNGFFGNVVPLEKKTNSLNLLNDLKQIIMSLKS